MKAKKKFIYIGLLVIFVIMQFFQIDKTLPESIPANDFFAVTNATGPMADMLKSACYDCHSNQTSFPWYSNVAPVSWWLNGHIHNGREHLNLSEWGTLEDKDRVDALEEMQEEVELKHMPVFVYTFTHSEARLSGDDRVALVTWLGGIAAGPIINPQ
jgi:hypothetical protein